MLLQRIIHVRFVDVYKPVSIPQAVGAVATNMKASMKKIRILVSIPQAVGAVAT